MTRVRSAARVHVNTLASKISQFDTSEILDQLAEDTERSLKEMLQNKDVFDDVIIRRQRNFAIRLRLLACEFLDIGD